MSERFAALLREATDLGFKLGAFQVGCRVVKRGGRETSRAEADFGDGEAIAYDHPDHEVAAERLLESLKARSQLALPGAAR